jgi:hypothetical protein
MEVEEKERDKTPHPHRFIDIRILYEAYNREKEI